MWIFNVADSFVCIGAGLLALWLILDMVKEAKAEKAKKLVAEGTAENSNTNKDSSTGGDGNE